MNQDHWKYANAVFSAIEQRSHWFLSQWVPVLLIIATLFLFLYRFLSDRYGGLKGLSVFLSGLTFTFTGIWVYGAIRDSRLVNHIKANPAETCATILYKVAGSGRNAQRVRFSYTVNGVNYESELVEYIGEGVSFNSIAVSKGYYVLIYNKSAPEECILDASRRLPECEQIY